MKEIDMLRGLYDMFFLCYSYKGLTTTVGVVGFGWLPSSVDMKSQVTTVHAGMQNIV